jgi:Zn finger protein HypA/HybF involved in hydrogenase expression
MHDLHLADKILQQILEHAKDCNLCKVIIARIKLGDVLEHGEMINPENLTFNLEMLSKSTIAEGAHFHIEKIELHGEYIIEEIEGDVKESI